MGEVYAAVDETLGRRVALKAIRPERRLSPSARARFVREARILSQLDHHHICRVYDFVTRDESDFIVLELIDGRSLRRALDEGLPRGDALRIAQEITSALVLAHSHGVVHRDLKPENVMLTAAGAVKVLDFGLASSDGSAAPSTGTWQPSGLRTPPRTLKRWPRCHRLSGRQRSSTATRPRP
jgi:serine/threonine protein kinase